jgi:hypothetical protein
MQPVVLSEIDQLKAEIVALKKDKKDLANELRQANVRHEGAHDWAMNNAKTLHSHLCVCRHDDVKELEKQLAEATAPKPRTSLSVLGMLVGKKLLR